MKARWNIQRTVRAQLRDARVLFQESRNSLILFASIIVGGALIFRYFYVYPDTLRRPLFSEALHATFALIFFETLLPFPEKWYLQILFFIIPILGLAVAADGILRFGAALLNKQARGQKWQEAMASTYNAHVVVCGMGKVGYRVTAELLKFGREVVGIEQNPEGRFVEKVKELGIPLIVADARRPESLIKAGIERADAVVPCTDDELANLDIALDARELNPGIKVVMRMFDSDLARRIERGFGIHTAFSTSELAAPLFATAAMRFNVKYCFYVGDTLLNVGEVIVEEGSRLTEYCIAALEKELDLSVISYQGLQGDDWHPSADLCLAAGDKVLVLASLEALEQLNEINRAKREGSRELRGD